MADRRIRQEISAPEFFSRWRATKSTCEERAAEEDLKNVPWAKPLLDNLKCAQESGNRGPQRAYLFEARIALSIARRGYEAVYEYKAGEGEKSIDFRVMSDPEMLMKQSQSRTVKLVRK